MKKLLVLLIFSLGCGGKEPSRFPYPPDYRTSEAVVTYLVRETGQGVGYSNGLITIYRDKAVWNEPEGKSRTEIIKQVQEALDRVGAGDRKFHVETREEAIKSLNQDLQRLQTELAIECAKLHKRIEEKERAIKTSSRFAGLIYDAVSKPQDYMMRLVNRKIT